MDGIKRTESKGRPTPIQVISAEVTPSFKSAFSKWRKEQGYATDAEALRHIIRASMYHCTNISPLIQGG